MVKGKKPSYVFLTVVLILSVTVVYVGADPQLPKLFLDPSIYPATQLGEIFIIDVNIANVTGLAGFEFKMGYNTTLLDALDAVEGPFPQHFIIKSIEINETEGYVWIYVACFPVNGNGTLATITFEVTYAESASCTLDLYDTVLREIDGDPIPHDVEDGNYQFEILSLTVATDNLSYLPGENVTIYGNMTTEVLPYEGFVGVEVGGPNVGMVYRTIQIGAPPPGDIVIVDVFPSDWLGTPKESFVRDTIGYFKVTVHNNAAVSKKVVVTINTYDKDNTPFGIGFFRFNLYQNTTSSIVFSVWIRPWTSLGNGTVFANVFTDFPSRGGIPYCPEENATFEITDGGQGGGSAGQSSSGDTGNYSLTFRLSNNTDADIYRVYVNVFYGGEIYAGRTVFGVNAIYVPDHYPTIQEAVDAATPTNNSILVFPGIYNEHVTINKSVTLVGIDSSNTIINGTGNVLTVVADNVEISRFTIQNSGSSSPDSSIILNNARNILISENTISDSCYGICLTNSSEENIIQDNTITLNNGSGIYVSSSDNNDIVDNLLSNNNYGIYMNHSTSLTLNNNTMVGNDYNFGVFGDSMSHFTHDIDTSNTVDGKPIIYWINQQDSEVPSNAGFVAIVNSMNITVRELDLKNNGQGVLFVSTTDSLIERVNTLNNEYGIYLDYSDRNIIVGSTLLNNTVGIHQRYCNDNIICHNNFTDNTNQLDIYQSSNTWDDNAGKGNYWSNYTGVDDGSGNRTAGDGVGDTLLPHQGVDWYPLMNPWILVHDVAVAKVTTVLPYNASHLYPGWKITVTAIDENEGDFIERFNVTAYYDGTLIEMKVITEMHPQTENAINIIWDTTGVSPGNYTISVNASVVSNETDTTDNTFVDGVVQVKLLGDVDGDGKVYATDMVLVLFHFGESATQFPEGDLDGDGMIYAIDMVIILINFGACGS